MAVEIRHEVLSEALPGNSVGFVSRIYLLKTFVVTPVIILSRPGQISAGCAPVLDSHTAHNAEGEDRSPFW